MDAETIEHEGWKLTVIAGEPVISDDVLAEHLGMDVKDLRALIKRHASETTDTVSGVSVPANITPISNPRTVRRFTKTGNGTSLTFFADITTGHLMCRNLASLSGYREVFFIAEAFGPVGKKPPAGVEA